MKILIRWSTALLIIFIFLFIGSYKYLSLHNWLFGSDIGSYDTILQETLKGNFGVEYTYGNSFGDHASFTLLFLLPFKLLLGPYMMNLLILLTPLFYLICGFVILFYAKRKKEISWPVMLTGMLAFILHLSVFRGNYEEIYGFHIDTASGYVMVIFAFLLQLHKEKRVNLKILLVVIYTWFLFLKEEMALLGLVFFLVLWIFSRDRNYLLWVVATLFVFGLQILLISYFKTPFNRGNEVFLTRLFQRISEHSTIGVLNEVPMNQFWNFILFYSITYGFLILFQRINKIAFALFVVALFKSAICFVTHDYFFYSWHGFPALALFSGAVILQAFYPVKSVYAKYNPVLLIMSIHVLILFISLRNDYEYSKVVRGSVHANKNYKEHVMPDLIKIKKLIPENHVLALNHNLTVEFNDGYRYSMYPRGVNMLPSGIADYVLINRKFKGASFLSIKLADELVPDVRDEFDTLAVNESFILYKRIKPHHTKDRKLFIKFCGKQTLE
ncbi:MAG TPA: hypothetical protein VE912_26520 [Bacteroidales bacterium]|nr:hypothetical protein [Bacteroidales bacterium]